KLGGIRPSSSNKRYSYLIITAVVLFNFIFTAGMLKEGYPNGGDSVGHYDLLLNTIDVVKIFFATGELRLWNPDYYLGFPMFFFYAPLPYFALALLSFPLGIIGITPLVLFKWSIVLLFSLLPLVFYLSGKIAVFEEDFCMGITLFSTVLSSPIVYGMEYYAFFATGLYSQLWGTVFFPLAFAFSYRFFALRKGHAFFPVLFLCLTFVSHLFMGVIAAISIVVLAISCIFFEKNKKSRMMLFRHACIIAFFFFLSISFFVVPYLLHADYFGNIPIDLSFKEQGYGLAETLRMLLDGELLDYSVSFSRLPLLTVLFGVGFFLSIFWKTFIKKYPALPLTLGLLLLLSIVCISGEKSFGFLEMIPILSSLQTFRFIALFHFVALLYIGIVVCWIFSFSESRWKTYFAFFILLLIVAPLFYERAQTFQEYATTHVFADDEDYWKAVQGIQEKTLSGRTYITAASGLFSKPQHLQAIPFLTGTEILASSSIGGHDSLNGYYSSFFLPIELAVFLGVNAVIDGKSISLDEKQITLYTTKNMSGYFSVLHAPFVLDATPLEARAVILPWIFSNASIEGHLIQIEKFEGIPVFISGITILHDIEENPNMLVLQEKDETLNHEVYGYLNMQNASSTIIVDSASGSERVSSYSYFQTYAATHEPLDCGSVSSETASRGYYTARVFVADVDKEKRCVVLFKMTYHPEWRVFVDGVEEEKIMLSPAFMGAVVAPGEHEVVFRYSVALYRKLLVVFSFLSLIALFLLRKKLYLEYYNYLKILCGCCW
ncbi:MAG: hypothetical protein AABX82_09510, partial [Nanoarchaeota archaeon]